MDISVRVDQLEMGDLMAMALLRLKEDRAVYTLVLRLSNIEPEWWTRIGIAYELGGDQ